MTPITEKIIEFRQNSLRIYRELEEKKRNRTKIVVHLGICGVSVGANEVFESFKDMVQAKGMEDQILVEKAGCIGLCSMEPLIQVIKPNMRRSMYCLINESMAEAIFSQHVLNGVIINPWLLSTRLERR